MRFGCPRGHAAKSQAIARLPDEQRIATLLAFVRTLEASANDDVLDLFDVVTKLRCGDAIDRRNQLNYRDALAKDLPIGSGEIESAHRYIAQQRLKRPGA